MMHMKQFFTVIPTNDRKPSYKARRIIRIGEFTMGKLSTTIDAPKELTIVLTTKCNLRCRLCYQTDFSSIFDMSLLDRLTHVIPNIEWLHPIGGEPLLCDLSPIFALSEENQCKTKLITNGTLITEERAKEIIRHVDRLIVSIDGGTDDAYRKMRGTNLSIPIEGIKRIQHQKKNSATRIPSIEINSLLTKTTIDSLPVLACKASELGVQRINLFYPSFGDPKLETEEKIKPDQAEEKINEAKGYLQIIKPKHRGGKICRRPWNTCFIDVKGNVFGCCYGSPPLGNLNTNTFEECWFGPMAQHLRETVNTEKALPSCKQCIVN